MSRFSTYNSIIYESVHHSKSKYLINENPGKLNQKMFKKGAAPSFIIPEDIVEGGGGGVDDRLDVNASLAKTM